MTNDPPLQGWEEAYALHQAGQLAEAEAAYRVALEKKPDDADTLCLLGLVLEALGRLEEAMAVWARAEEVLPGYAVPQTLRSLAHLRHREPVPVPPKPSLRPAVGNLSLGNMGRFGNQVYQYAFLRICGKELGLEVRTPDWQGRYLFKGANDPMIGEGLRVIEDETVALDALKRRYLPDLANTDLRGYFQFGLDFYNPYREFLAPIFEPAPSLEKETAALEAAIRARGGPLVALHIRRGDVAHVMPPPERFKAWLEPRWAKLGEKPVLYIASDGLEEVLPLFAEYGPMTAADTGVTVPGADFWTDFQVLRMAHMAAVSRSTFSQVALLLNAQIQEAHEIV